MLNIVFRGTLCTTEPHGGERRRKGERERKKGCDKMWKEERGRSSSTSESKKRERGRQWVVVVVGRAGVRADRVAWHFPVRTNCSEKSTKRQKKKRGRVTLRHRLQKYFSFIPENIHVPGAWTATPASWLACVCFRPESNLIKDSPNWLMCLGHMSETCMCIPRCAEMIIICTGFAQTHTQD